MITAATQSTTQYTLVRGQGNISDLEKYRDHTRTKAIPPLSSHVRLDCSVGEDGGSGLSGVSTLCLRAAPRPAVRATCET